MSESIDKHGRNGRDSVQILVVDDDKGIRDTVQGAIQEAG